MRNSAHDFVTICRSRRWRQNYSSWRALLCWSPVPAAVQLLKRRHCWTDHTCRPASTQRRHRFSRGLVATLTRTCSSSLMMPTTRRRTRRRWRGPAMERGSGCRLRATSPSRRTSRLRPATSAASTVASCATESNYSHIKTRRSFCSSFLVKIVVVITCVAEYSADEEQSCQTDWLHRCTSEVRIRNKVVATSLTILPDIILEPDAIG